MPTTTVVTALGPASAALTQAQDHLALWCSTDRAGGPGARWLRRVLAIDATMAALHEAPLAPRWLSLSCIDTIDRAERVGDMLGRLIDAHAEHGFDYQRATADGALCAKI